MGATLRDLGLWGNKEPSIESEVDAGVQVGAAPRYLGLCGNKEPSVESEVDGECRWVLHHVTLGSAVINSRVWLVPHHPLR